MSLEGNSLQISDGNAVNLPQYIEQIEAGFGLTGGGSPPSASLSVDPTIVQRRVAACAPGNAIRSIEENGTVTCESTPWTGSFFISATNKIVEVSNGAKSPQHGFRV